MNVKISRKVWESFSASEQEIAKRLLARHGWGTIKAFLLDLRKFGGTYIGGWRVDLGERRFVWRGEDSRGFFELTADPPIG